MVCGTIDPCCWLPEEKEISSQENYWFRVCPRELLRSAHYVCRFTNLSRRWCLFGSQFFVKTVCPRELLRGRHLILQNLYEVLGPRTRNHISFYSLRNSEILVDSVMMVLLLPIRSLLG